MNELPSYWQTVIDVMTTYIDNREDPWTMQTYGGNYAVAPYVQALQEHDNMLLLEATSNKFLDPPLSNEKHEVMLFLGWRHFPEEMYPNYSQILDQSIFTPNEIAKMLAKTLHLAYGVDNSFNFEIAPYRSDAALVIQEEESTVSMDDFLIERVRKPYPPETPVVSLSTPVVSFGNPNISRVATVGINPSRREFESRDRGALLEKDSKRLVDLNTLGAKSCESLTHDQAREVLEGCFDYFAGTTHYGEWFDPLEQAVLNPIEASYFGRKTHSAVHLDLVQWATDPVWSQIEDRELASTLLEEDSGFLRKQLQTYNFTYVFLNGKEVCEQIQNLGIYELSHVGDLQWKSGEGSRTSKIYTGVGTKGEIVVGWTLNIQGMKVTNQERSRIYAEIAKWIQICIQPKGTSKDAIHIPQDAGATVGYEELAEAYIKTIHFEAVYHPDYWSTFIELLRAALEISTGDQSAWWLDYVVNDIRMTTRIMPTEEALELSVDIPPGVAQDATYRKFSKEIDRMRLDLVEVNREYLRVLIREILGKNASKRIPMAQLIAAGLPEAEPPWSVLDWAENY